jgi:UDP:flavonoid glycosyltransferase YjiC (YdhE family)
MRVLLTTIGTAGDIHPFIAVGLALKTRGHEVAILANPYYAARINGAGLGYWPLGKEADYLAFARNADLIRGRKSTRLVIDKLILPSFEVQANGIDSAWRTFRPNVIVGHHICFGAQAACEKLGIPYAQIVLSPVFWLSRQEQVVLPTWPLRKPPVIVDRFVRSLSRTMGRMSLDRPLNKMRAELGVPRRRDFVVKSARGGDGLLANERLLDADDGIKTLGLWSPLYRGKLADDPRPGVICGFAPWDRPTLSSQQQVAIRETIEWMEKGQAPVLVTLGSSVAPHAKKIYESVREACAKLSKRVVLLTGADDGAVWTTEMRSLPYAPYSLVMPRSMLIVHHAGIGTVGAAMRAGRPSLAIPHANDEYDNAERVRRLGIGSSLRPEKLSVPVLCAMIDRLISDREMARRCKEIGEKMQTENGAGKAAVEIETVR